MLDKNSNTTVVLKYYLYRATGGPGFMSAVYILYLLAHGLTFAEIGTIGAVQSAIVVTGELPSGYIGDRIGRRNSLLIGQLLYTASAVGLIFGNGFLAFVLAFSLLSFGQTFVSGSGDAWLYDTLKENLDQDRYTHVRGRGSAVGQWVTAVMMILGGFLYVMGHVYPFVALLMMRLVTALVVLSMPKNSQYADDADTDEDTGDLTVVEALPIIREQLAQPPLRSFVAYMALFLAVTMTVTAYIQPITVDALRANAGSLLSSLGVPEAATLGILYAAFTATSAIASDRASDIEAALGIRKAMLVVPVLTGVLLVVPVFAPIVAFPMFFGLKASQSVLRPISGQYLNDNVESLGRATMLSAVSMVYALARIPFAVGSGVVADVFSPLIAVAALGATFLTVGGSMFLLWPPVKRRSRVRSPDGTTSD